MVFRVNSGGDLTWPTEYKRMTEENILQLNTSEEGGV